MTGTVPAAEPQRLAREFSFAGSIDAMGAAREQMMQFIGEHCSSEAEELDIMIALQEALANAVLHGCRNDSSQTVRCLVEVDPSGLTIIVRDPGPGFQVESATETTDAGENLTEHGRGIYLMRSLMDEVQYRNRGSELRLRKLRSGGQTPANV